LLGYELATGLFDKWKVAENPYNKYRKRVTIPVTAFIALYPHLIQELAALKDNEYNFSDELLENHNIYGALVFTSRTKMWKEGALKIAPKLVIPLFGVDVFDVL
jgi:hypothetical protein